MSLLDYCNTERQKEVIRLYLQLGSARQTAKQLQRDESSIAKQIAQIKHRAALAGYAPEVGINNPAASGFDLSGGYSTYGKDENGNPTWFKYRKSKEEELNDIQKAIDGFLEGVKPLKAPKAPRKVDTDVIPWYQIGDAHFGMLAHEWEVGHNFDLKIAYQELASAFALLMDEAQPTERCVINDLGDFTHYENFRGETEASGHQMDRDGRFPKMIDLYADLMLFIVDAALKKHKHVDVIINQGNHSRSNDIWMVKLLRSAYRNDKDRITALNNANVFIPYRMGNTFVLVHHGDKAKPQNLASVMANDFRQDWGETEYHYIDGGHYHHKVRSVETGGAIFEMWNTLAPADKYANDLGLRSTQSITRVDRSKQYGEVGRRVLPIKEVREHLLKAVTKSDYIQPERREVYTV